MAHLMGASVYPNFPTGCRMGRRRDSNNLMGYLMATQLFHGVSLGVPRGNTHETCCGIAGISWDTPWDT